MFEKLKTSIAHMIALLSPKTYVDIINSVVNGEELDEELRRRIGFDK